jgi:signal transduction histidine kinase
VFTRNHIEPLAYFASQAAAIIENAILNEQMESLIVARTAELREANAQLRHEMAERARIEKQLIEIAVERERSQVLRQFIQNVSHQFRTPLSIIQIAAGLIRAKYSLPKDDRHLEQIQDQIGVIVELLENMVLMVQLDGQKPEKVFSELNVAHLIQSMESHWLRLSAEKHQTLSIDLPPALLPAPPLIHGDIELLQQALNHLVKNAVQYTPETGNIEVIVRLHEDAESPTLNITVADSGPGIAQDEHEVVFQRFYRGDKAGTTRGFGLGLSILQLITSLHGGTLLLESESDKGSRFTIRLPVGE